MHAIEEIAEPHNFPETLHGVLVTSSNSSMSKKVEENMVSGNRNECNYAFKTILFIIL